MNLRRNSSNSQACSGENDSSKEAKKAEKKCGTCSKVCQDNEKVLLCQVCDRHFHSTCQKVDDDQYKVICSARSKANPNMIWFCDSSCSLFAGRFMCSMLEMKRGLDQIREDVDIVAGRVDQMDGRVCDLENGLFSELHEEQVRRLAKEEIESNDNEKPTERECAEQLIDDKFQDAVSAAVKEIKERSYRKKSIVVFGIEMSDSKSIKSRVDHDRKSFENLCQKGLDISKKIAPKKIIRLGKKEDKERPMKISFDSYEIVGEILKSAPNLKKRDKDDFKDISISSDKTPLERRERKKLVELRKLKQRMSDEKGEKVKWIIKGNRVMIDRENAEEEEETLAAAANPTEGEA